MEVGRGGGRERGRGGRARRERWGTRPRLFRLARLGRGVALEVEHGIVRGCGGSREVGKADESQTENIRGGGEEREEEEDGCRGQWREHASHVGSALVPSLDVQLPVFQPAEV